MINLPEIREAIIAASAYELRTLGETPTSQAIVRQLATRTHFVVSNRVIEAEFDIYLCQDESRGSVQIPSPFVVIVCDSDIRLSTGVASRVVVDLVSTHVEYDQCIEPTQA